ncbi:hypothetical protein COE80_28685 [Bacillus pseudomycoides]|nr:hypothetical protein COM62_12695 [Bacillus pseudomycoides]PHB16225.1 hypothetical protein COE80_28685 [Bacillus pseudomycoides]PHE39004.1 hypothetical protein COF51_09000 [Bacillus pseudomycoides]
MYGQFPFNFQENLLVGEKYTIPSELICMVISIKRIVYFFRLGGNSFSWLDSDVGGPHCHQVKKYSLSQNEKMSFFVTS